MGLREAEDERGRASGDFGELGTLAGVVDVVVLAVDEGYLADLGECSKRDGGGVDGNEAEACVCEARACGEVVVVRGIGGEEVEVIEGGGVVRRELCEILGAQQELIEEVLWRGVGAGKVHGVAGCVRGIVAEASPMVRTKLEHLMDVSRGKSGIGGLRRGED